MQKITPFLWFNDQAEEAAQFYTSVFKNSRITSVSRYGDAFPERSGEVLTVTFELEGLQFTALNGGPEFSFTPAISFAVDCTSQAEVDALWGRLTEGGEESMCGWLIDQFGVSWQIVPRALIEMMNDPNPVKAQKVTEAMLQMRKLDLNVLQQVYDQA